MPAKSSGYRVCKKVVKYTLSCSFTARPPAGHELRCALGYTLFRILLIYFSILLQMKGLKLPLSYHDPNLHELQIHDLLSVCRRTMESMKER